MVGVASNIAGDQLSSVTNPAIKYMLKVRESHARNQVKDYSHVFRPKTRLELVRLSAIAMAIEFAYAAESSFVSPILLQIGIDHKLMTMAWGLSPLIGFFMSPLLGSISDRCQLNWGRRRPIITLLSLGIFLGLILVPFGKVLGIYLANLDGNTTMMATSFNNYSTTINATMTSTSSLMPATMTTVVGGRVEGASMKFAIILTIVGMVLLDFDADTAQTPARTYLLDMCTPEDQPKALTTFTLMAGFGGMIGYAMGGIDWEQWHIGVILGGNIPTVFLMVTAIFVVCYLVTITTLREIPLRLIEKDELLRPLSAEAIDKELSKKTSTIYYIKETTTLELRMAEEDEGQGGADGDRSYQNGTAPVDEAAAAASGRSHELTGSSAAQTISLAQYLRSIFVMPHSMRILALTNLLCWMGHVTYCLYFTDFVGEAVFHGDPLAEKTTEAGMLYAAGVRFGCWGMSIYALSCSVFSMVVNKLMLLFGTRTVYIAGILTYGVGMLILGLWPTKWGVLVFSIAAGILYGTVFTLPYMLVAHYHAKNCFRVRNGETVPLKQTRGLGTDIAIISSMVFVAQFIVSLSMGPLIAWMQTTCAILYASTFLAVLAAISACFVLYP